jgi:hypothetical protein
MADSFALFGSTAFEERIWTGYVEEGRRTIIPS